MKRILTILGFILIVISTVSLYGQSTRNHRSYVEVPYIVMTGQIVEITPFSIKVGNTAYETRATNEQVRRLVEEHLRSLDFRSHGFGRALNTVEIKDGRMQMGFYLDNLTKVFHDEVQTYMRFLPLLYLFQNNTEILNLPDKVKKDLKKLSMENVLGFDYVKNLLQNSWFVGVFKIHPDTGKLIYHASNFYKNYDDIESDEFAQEYRVPGIIKAGMTVTMTKAVITGDEQVEYDDEKGYQYPYPKPWLGGPRKSDDAVRIEGSGGVKGGK
jgi:uncharacterized membrane protein